jgi:integrase/recombinase XerD
MKTLPIYNDSFRAILKDFENDLEVRNFDPMTVYYMESHLREFFHYLETMGCNDIQSITTKMVSKYYEQLSKRKNQRRSGALCNGSLNKHQQALRLFQKYLKKMGVQSFGVHLKGEKPTPLTVKDILTEAEIFELFDACDHSHKLKRYRLRDKAMLTILYGCGLRTHQMVALDLKDIDFKNRKLLIRDGDQNKKRDHEYQVLLPSQIEILENYIYFSRPHFYRAKFTKAMFVNKNGGRMQGKAHRNRFAAIVKTANNQDIIDKNPCLHNLRHSIATHLYCNGMTIQKVQRFLGHASLEATQIYTHLAEELNAA